MITNLGMALGVCIFETAFSFSLPADVSCKGMSIKSANLSPKVLFSGFQNVFALGVIISFAALAISLTAIFFNKRS
jgi:hypothetical protein